MAQDTEVLSNYWWSEPKGQVHQTIFAIIRHLEQNQNDIREMNLRHMRLYGNLNVLGLSASTYSRQHSKQDRITFNIIQSMCDTVTQKIAKNKPKPTFLTSGGDYTLKKKAKKLQKFVAGQFYATDLYEKEVKVFRDATIFGTGELKIYRDGNEIKVDRVFIDELKVDQTDGFYGEPRSKYQVKFMTKEVMVKNYPSFKDKIMACQRADNSSSVHASLSNVILVVEAWHLPSNDKAKDGRHMICIENADLIDEKYDRDYFPFVKEIWNDRLLGYFGQGLAEQLTGIQVEINKILQTIQLSMRLCSVPRYWNQKGNKVIKSHINNDIGTIVDFVGEPPRLDNSNAVPTELFSHLERLYSKAYELAGVSQLAAQSKKPGGLDSGKALREFNDIESERFVLVGQMREQVFMECARQMIDLAKEIHADMKEGGGPGYSVQVPGKKFLETINWEDVDMKDDEYMMQIFPTSMLSSTPSGKLQDVQDLVQAGFIDQKNALSLLDFPDLESYMNLANAGIEDIENMIEAMIDRGEYQAPEPFQDLALGIKMVQSSYLKAKSDKVDEEKLELLRRWMEEANVKLNPPPAPSSASASGAGLDASQAPSPMGAPGVSGGAGGMPSGQPLAAPVAPPTSALLPNAPGAQ